MVSGLKRLPALGCFEAGDDYGSFTYPGFTDWDCGATDEKEEPYIFHFPDGNASVARLLVRSLIPEAIPGTTMDDVVTAKADYSKLDDANSAVRIRLNSTVVHVQHTQRGKGSASFLCAWWEATDRQRKELRAGLLQRDDSIHLSGAAGEAKRSAVLSCENAAGVYARGAAELDFVFEAGCASDCGAGRISHVHGAGFSREHRANTRFRASRKSRWCCSCCERRASQGCRCAISIALGAWN